MISFLQSSDNEYDLHYIPYDMYSVLLSVLFWSHYSPWQSYVNYSYSSGWLAWWRHQMETFSALLALCAGSSPVSGEFPAQRPVTRSFDVFFDLRLNKRLSKQSWGWWFETPSRSLWRHRNVTGTKTITWSQENCLELIHNKTQQSTTRCIP